MRKPVKIVLRLLLGGSLALASCTSEPSDLGLSLIRAAAEGDTKAVETLLAAGADVNAKSAAGTTALMFARRRGSTDIVHMLKKAGGGNYNPSREDQGRDETQNL